MNFKQVLRAYSLLRQLSDDESALLATLRAMSDTERELLVESLQPEKGSGKKKVVKKAGGGSGKSQRASSLAATLDKSKLAKKPMCVACGSTDPDDGEHGTGERQHEFSTDLAKRVNAVLDKANQKCDFEIDGKVCHGLKTDAIHDATMGYAAYHEFVPPAVSAAGGGS